MDAPKFTRGPNSVTFLAWRKENVSKGRGRVASDSESVFCVLKALGKAKCASLKT